MIEDVLGALAEARALGFLGPGTLEAHVVSGEAFATALGSLADGSRLLDLGSGGGVPGILLAGRFPSTQWVLLDGNRRRTSFLARVVAELGWAARVEVVRAPAEEAARDRAYRGQFVGVTARSFGPPAVTAEAAAGFLAPTGRLLVAEPPTPDDGRWPASGLDLAGLRFVGRTGTVPAIAILESPVGAPSEIPRPRRAMDRMPLWS